jgi:hypothetical protein
MHQICQCSGKCSEKYAKFPTLPFERAGKAPNTPQLRMKQEHRKGMKKRKSRANRSSGNQLIW